MRNDHLSREAGLILDSFLQTLTGSLLAFVEILGSLP